MAATRSPGLTSAGSRSIRVHAIARPVHEWLTAETRAGRTIEGHVLATFERSCYLEFERGLVAVVNRSLRRGAFAITLAEDIRLDGLIPADEALLTREALHVGDLFIDLSAGKAWDPALPPLSGEAGPQMKALHSFLLSAAPDEGLSRIRHDGSQNDEKPALKAARSALALLRAGISGGNPSYIQQGAGALAGVGPGLTPSGDDVLAGSMLALRIWPQTAGPMGPDGVARLILETASPRTGKVSRAYLEAAARGDASEPWHDLVTALSRDSNAVVDAAKRIMQIGETSGADTLAGFLHALLD